VTPEGNGSSIISFRVRDPEATQKKLERASVIVTMITQYKLMRVSISVFTTDADLDQLVNALRA
jgi:selenocysteine lyase/cysteine desulfurase